MHLLIASGESKSSEVWANEVAAALSDRFENPVVLPYAHWRAENGTINLEAEAKHLGELATRAERPYAIFAKSIGTLVALKALHDGRLKPAYCVFVGLPFDWTKDKTDVATWLKDYSVRTLFVQQEDDPAMSYDELVAVLEERDVADASTREVSGDDHHYSNVAEIAALVNEFAAVQSQ